MVEVDRLEQGEVTVLRLKGEIDETGMNAVRLSINECLADNRARIVLNLSAVGFISFFGVGVLVEALRQTRRAGGDVKLVGVNVYADRLLRMSSVHKLFERFGQETIAIRAYRQAA